MDRNKEIYVLTDGFTVEPEKQTELSELLTEATERLMNKL